MKGDPILLYATPKLPSECFVRVQAEGRLRFEDVGFQMRGGVKGGAGRVEEQEYTAPVPLVC